MLSVGLLYVAVSRAQGAPPPLGKARVPSLLVFHYGVGCFGLLSQK